LLNKTNFILIIFIITLVGIFYLFKPFLEAMFIALLLGIATSNIHAFIDRNIQDNKISTSLSASLFFLLFFAPFGYFISNFAQFINNLDTESLRATIQYSKEFTNSFINDYEFLRSNSDEFLASLDPAAITQKFISISSSFGKASATFVKDLILITIFYTLFLLYSKQIGNFVNAMLPLSNKDTIKLYNEVSNTMSVVLYSILVTAVFEGALFGLMVAYFGFDGLLFGILYGLASLVPIIGGALMWIPLSLYELSQNNNDNAIFIALYSIIVISIIADTFIKPIIIDQINSKLVSTPTNISSLIIFFSIIAGLTTFGFWGMIIGPALTALFFSVVKLYQSMLEKPK